MTCPLTVEIASLAPTTTYEAEKTSRNTHTGMIPIYAAATYPYSPLHQSQMGKRHTGGLPVCHLVCCRCSSP